MSGSVTYVKGVNTADGLMPFFPPNTDVGMVWGVQKGGIWGPIAAGSGGSVPSMDEIVSSVLAALPTWDGGVY
jgi:hypothetical protein